MKCFRSAVLLLLVLVASASLVAQGTTSALTGTVRLDGNPLPGATVTVNSPALQGARVAVTDVNGNYNIGALRPGQYTVRFEMEGMQTVTQQVAVTLAATARANAALRLSAVAEAITVTAAAPAVLESSEVQTNLQSGLIADLPLSRTFTSTANLAPGVTTNTPSGSQLVISGAPASESLYLVNGAVVNENIRSQVHSLFIEDAIQEQTVFTGAISAEYGRFTGGVVSAITKSGGNEFSGSIRDNFTNPAWTKVSAFPGQQKNLDKLNETYEGTLGGRIIRDRLWFFTAGRYYKVDAQNFFYDSTIPFTTSQEQTRYEVKLTGQVTPKHSLVGAYLSNDTEDADVCVFTCYDPSSLDVSRSLPSGFTTGHYNGIITNNFLVEMGYSKKTFAFEGAGGDYSDFARATWAYDVNAGAFFGGTTFCGFCDPEKRDNRNYNLKATYYLATPSLGTHNIVAGYDDFWEQRKGDNFQSGSNFGIYTFNAPDRAGSGEIHPVYTDGDLIRWSPIFITSKGSELVTRSVYLNDRLDLNDNFSFNLGARYDKNDGVDSAGNPVSDDSAISPRFGVTWDVKGDGRLRVNAGYATYVSHIQEGIGGSGASPAGNPAYFLYQYHGPDIRGVDYVQANQMFYDWFQTQCNDEGECGFENFDLLVGAAIPGLSTIIPESLKSPSVDEFTIGIGSQVGANGFVRADYVDRDFRDFYSNVTAPAGTIVADDFGNESDLNYLVNGDYLRRTYKAAMLQASYRFSPRFNLGGNYTWSSTKGNFISDTSGSGPVPDAHLLYPEYRDFSQNNPYGPIDTLDQTHKARLFATYDRPTPFGGFTFGVLESFDSGLPYSELGFIDPRPYVDDLGYATPPSSVAYYFSGRGAHRWEDRLDTDLSVTYSLPISKVTLWAKGDVLNVFDSQAQVLGNVTVLTATSGSCIQSTGADAGKRCAPFNPFTETPVEGVHYRKGSRFAQATTPTTASLAGHYELPRTYRFSVGVKF